MTHPSSLPPGGSAVLNDRPVACQIRGPTDPQGDRWHGEAVADEASFVSCPARRQCPPNTTAASAATYPLRCSAPQWARFDNRHSISAPAPILSLHQRQPAQGLFRAPARATFVCGDKSSQKHRLDLRSKNPSRAILSCAFPHFLADIAFHHRCRSKGLRVRSPARRLTRPLASATAGVFRSYRRTPISLPFEGSVLLSGAPPKPSP